MNRNECLLLKAIEDIQAISCSIYLTYVNKKEFNERNFALVEYKDKRGTMKELVSIVNGVPMTTSLIVKDVFGKRHDDVLKAIKNLECSQEYRLRNFAESSYKNKQNKKQLMYIMNRDGWTILVMGFTGKKAMEFKEKYIVEFNRMEEELKNNATSVIDLTKPACFDVSEMEHQFDTFHRMAHKIGYIGPDAVQFAIDALKKNHGCDILALGNKTYFPDSNQARNIIEGILDNIVNEWSVRIVQLATKSKPYKSKGEFALELILRKKMDEYGEFIHKIGQRFELLQNKTIEGCKDKIHLQFDVILRPIRCSESDVWGKNCQTFEAFLVFEFQGIHHFQADRNYQGSRERLEERKRKDQIKRKFCDKNKIELVTIPYFEDVAVFVLEALNRKNFIPDDDFDLLACRRLKTGTSMLPS